jgi:hypothetical protein
MSFRPKSTGFGGHGASACVPLRRKACGTCEGGRQAAGEAPHTMPPAIRKTAVLTKRPRTIGVYPRPRGAPMPLPHHEKPGEHHGR